jgi:3-hydroxyacyl-CoA dehydrogenase
MFYGDLVGAEKILATMQSLAADNPAIQPAKTLEKLAKEGGKFVALDLGGLKTG